jgi:hypothetical protein
MDSIVFHNSYKHWGWFFDLNSWRDLYNKPNWFSKLFGASFNAWHVAKYTMVFLFTLSLYIAYMSSVEPLDALLFGIGGIFYFIVGFKIAYV